MPPEIEYIVIVKSKVAKPPPNVTSYTVAKPVRIVRPRATSPEEAADKAGVAPGETAIVVPASEAQTFTRPEKAPLVAA